ncbi:response regulator transcription factor [Bifidobacterium sp. ESL0704]|uniref:response regulator n=1 Tax=Bifidobacterium sp. ESL0704 TaxID=2983219 RepID=UPI0023F89906|nr:response regulator transcription factor [Bifidobacterium sp. ESL0704]WEV52597.1 response regulator transcription factor [Bifidobacterium sp. ESL0704]
MDDTSRPVRVMLVDDDRMARTAFMMMLAGDGSMTVCAQSANGREALAMLQEAKTLPDVILMDVRMPVMDGIEATARITHLFPAVKVLILTTYDQDDYAFDGLARGASGFLLKDVTIEQLRAAIHSVVEGDAVLTPRVTRAVVERSVRRIGGDADVPELRNRLARLSPREHEIVSLIAEGLSNSEIAGRLTIETSSVRKDVSRILSKLALRDRTQIAVMWYKAGLDVTTPR